METLIVTNGHTSVLSFHGEPRLIPAGPRKAKEQDSLLPYKLLARANYFSAPSLIEFAHIPYRKIAAALGFSILALGVGYAVDQVARIRTKPLTAPPKISDQTIIDRVFGPAGLSVSSPDEYRNNNIPYPPNRR